MLPQIHEQTILALVHKRDKTFKLVVTDWGDAETNDKLLRKPRWNNTFMLGTSYVTTLSSNVFELEIIDSSIRLQTTYATSFKLTATDLEVSWGEGDYVKLSATSEFKLLSDFTPPPDADDFVGTEANYVKLSAGSALSSYVDWTPPADTSLPATNSHEPNYVKLTAGTPTGVTYTFHG